MDCIKSYEDHYTPEEKDLLERMERIESKVLGDTAEFRPYAKALRRTLYMPDGAGDPVHGLADWFYDVTGVNLKAGQMPQRGDLEAIEAMVNDRLDVIKSVGTSVDKGHFIHPAMELLLPILPESKFRTKIVNGEHLWRDINIHQSRKESMISSAYRESAEINDEITRLTGEDLTENYKGIDNVMKEVDKARGMRHNLENKRQDVGLSKEEEVELKYWAQHESEQKLVLDKIRGVTGSSKSAKLTKKIIEMIHDEGIDLDRSSDPAANAAARRLIESTGLDLRPSQVIALAKSVDSFFKKRAVDVNEAMSLAKSNLKAAMEWRGLPQSYIEKTLSAIPESKQRKNYFPQRNVLTLWDVQNLTVEIENKAMSKMEIDELVQGVVDGSMNTRESDAGITDRMDQHIPRVMGHYGAEIAHLLMVNRVHSSFNTALSMVDDIPLGSEGRQKYMEMLKNELNNIHEKIVPPSQPARRRVMMSLIGMIAAHKMGPLQIPGMINNVAEGQSILWSRQGLHMVNQINKLLEGPLGREIDAILETESVEMVAGQEYGDFQELSRNARLNEMFDSEQLRRFGMIESETSALVKLSMKSADKVTKVSNLMTTTWRAAENFNRKSAFKIGAAIEYQRTVDQYRAMFEARDISHSLARRHGLDIDAIEHGTPEDLEAQWTKFARDRSAKAGYDMLFKTQWIYNMTARHALEGVEFFGLPVGKAVTTFQHYGLSWNTAAYTLYNQVRGLQRVGGNLAWIGHATTADIRSGRARPLKGVGGLLRKVGEVDKAKELESLVINPNAQYMMSIGIAAMSAKVIAGFFNLTPTNYLNGGQVAGVIGDIRDKLLGAENEDINFGSGLAGETTGPIYNDLMDALALFSSEVMGVDTADMPRPMEDFLEFGLGFNTSRKKLTNNYTRNFNNTFDVINEGIGWEANSTLRKSRRLLKGLSKNDDPYSKMGTIAVELLPMYPDWDKYRQMRKKKEDNRP